MLPSMVEAENFSDHPCTVHSHSTVIVMLQKNLVPDLALSIILSAFFLSCEANAREKPVKAGNGPHSSSFCVVICIVCFVSLSVLFACICVLYYCHRVATEYQLNISYHYHKLYIGYYEQG
jgi:hypothetical protein